MANQAYAFDRFAPKPAAPETPRVRVVKTRPRAKTQGKLRVAGTLLCVAVLAGLIVGVLLTEARVTELQAQIASENKQLVEEQALSVYLTNELDSMANLKNIEHRAAELGLVKQDSSQVTYIQVQEENRIEVQPSGFMKFLDSLRLGFLNVMDYIMP